MYYQYAKRSRGGIILDVRTIRLENLQRLVTEAGGQKALAQSTGVSAAYICQVLSDKVARNVGHSLARRLEQGMKKPFGWMDTNRDPPDEWDTYSDRLHEADFSPYGSGLENSDRDGWIDRARMPTSETIICQDGEQAAGDPPSWR